MTHPAFDGYFADPFVLATTGGYVAYGGSGAVSTADRVVECLTSADLLAWTSHGHVLGVPAEFRGWEFWAPEVLAWNDAYWMYYSVGEGIAGHHIRVARSDSPLGPFIDHGVDLTPSESFAIDAHPFVDTDGSIYLYFAHDVLDANRAGTHIAVVELASPTETRGAVRPILQPNADWQIYERDRPMYGSRYDWHTLEGPSVVHRAGRYWMTYSGGAWTGADYAVNWAVADGPMGPWTHAPAGTPPLLATGDDYLGPGHNSLTVDPHGNDVIAFHSWDASQTARQLQLRHITFRPEGPRVDGPIRGPFEPPRESIGS